MASESWRPDFFLLGAAKCGTTSLYTWLQQHPEICMSWPKEPRFFSGGFELGLDWYRTHCFAHARGEKVFGDASHRNLYHSHVAERIFSVNPKARFIVILRDPVERALAHWWTEYRRGREWLTFDEAIQADWHRVRYGIEMVPRPELPAGEKPSRPLLRILRTHRNYLDGGHYAEQLERYFRIFSRDRVRVLTLDALRADPRGVMKNLFEFLEVEPKWADEIDVRPVNAARKLRVHWRRRPGQLLQQWRAHRRSGGWTPARLLERPPMTAKTREFLEAHYRPHDARLRALLGPDFALWPEPGSPPARTTAPSREAPSPGSESPAST